MIIKTLVFTSSIVFAKEITEQDLDELFMQSQQKETQESSSDVWSQWNLLHAEILSKIVIDNKLEASILTASSTSDLNLEVRRIELILVNGVRCHLESRGSFPLINLPSSRVQVDGEITCVDSEGQQVLDKKYKSDKLEKLQFEAAAVESIRLFFIELIEFSSH